MGDRAYLDLIERLAKGLHDQHDTYGGTFSSHDIGDANRRMVWRAVLLLRDHGYPCTWHG